MNRNLLAAIGIAVTAISLPSGLVAQIETTEASTGPLQTEAAEAAPSQERALSFEVGVGLEYDSNVALLEVDSSSNVGDMVASMKFGLGYEAANDGRFGFSAGYDFSQTMHEDLDAFDLRLHRSSGTLSWDFGRVDFGVMLQHADAELDGQSFMQLTQISPYLTKLAGSKLFFRFAYVDTDKDFTNNAQRAATADALTSDIYIFLDGLTTYLLLGARIDDEDAIDAQFDYEAEKFRIQLSHRFPLRSRELTFRAGVRTESRDYSSVTPSIGAIRSDDRIELETSAELPLGERMTATFDYTRANNDSNLASVDFDENVVSFGLTAAF